MSTQPEPAQPLTEAGRIQRIREDIHERVGDDYPLLGLLVDLEDAATAAARAEVARQVRELPWNVSGSTDDPEWAVSEYRDAVLALLEDAAPRETEAQQFLRENPEIDAALNASLDAYEFELRPDAAPRQPEPETRSVKPKPGLSRLTLDGLRDRAEAAGITYWGEEWTRRDFIDALSAAPDTTTGTTDD